MNREKKRIYKKEVKRRREEVSQPILPKYTYSLHSFLPQSLPEEVPPYHDIIETPPLPSSLCACYTHLWLLSETIESYEQESSEVMNTYIPFSYFSYFLS